MKIIYEKLEKEFSIKGVNLYEQWRKEQIQSIIRINNKFIVNLKHLDPFYGEETYQTMIIKES